MTQVLQPHTPTIIQIVKDDPAPQLSMIDVAVAAFGLTGVIMAAALVAGLLVRRRQLMLRTPPDGDRMKGPRGEQNKKPIEN